MADGTFDFSCSTIAKFLSSISVSSSFSTATTDDTGTPAPGCSSTGSGSTSWTWNRTNDASEPLAVKDKFFATFTGCCGCLDMYGYSFNFEDTEAGSYTTDFVCPTASGSGVRTLSTNFGIYCKVVDGEKKYKLTFYLRGDDYVSGDHLGSEDFYPDYNVFPPDPDHDVSAVYFTPLLSLNELIGSHEITVPLDYTVPEDNRTQTGTITITCVIT